MTLADLGDRLGAAGTEVSVSIGGMTSGACGADRKPTQRTRRRRGTGQPGVGTGPRAMPMAVSPALVVERIESAGFTATIIDDLTSTPDDAAEADRRVRYLGRRLVVAGLLFMPLSDASLAFWLVPSLRFPGWQWILIALAVPILTWAAWPFYKAAIRSARHGIATMDTLVSMGIAAATAWSIYAMFFRDTSHVSRTFRYVLAHQSGGAIYLDVAAGVTTFLLLGRYFEARSKRRTGSACRALSAVGAKDVAILDATGVGRPTGRRTLRRRSFRRPARRDRRHRRRGRLRAVGRGPQRHDRRVGAGRCHGGRHGAGLAPCASEGASSCGRRSWESDPAGPDAPARRGRPRTRRQIERLADRIAGVFVPTVIGISLMTSALWLVSGGTSEEAFSRALRADHCVPLRARPRRHPTALMVASGEGARSGHLLQGLSGPRGIPRDRHGASRQDGDADGRGDGCRRPQCCRWRCPGGPVELGRVARTRIGAPGGQGHRRAGRQEGPGSPWSQISWPWPDSEPAASSMVTN